MIAMTDILIKAITAEYSESIETQVKNTICKFMGSSDVSEIRFSPFIRYWKSLTQGELTCQFSTAISLADVQHLFADTWQADIADSRWSNIY